MQQFLNGVSDVLGALAGKRFALDGNLYTFNEFKRHYPSNYNEMWRDAIPEHERRLHEGIPHDAGWFYRHYNIGSLPESDHKKWRFGQPKYGWATAALPGTERREFGVRVTDSGKIRVGMETERRKANDGQFYSFEEFKLHYGHDAQRRWDSAEKESVNLLGSSSRGVTTSSTPTNFGHSSPQGKRFALNGQLYSFSEFQQHYGSNAMSMWTDAIPDYERRLHEGVPHDAGWFYRYYNIGSLPESDHKKWRVGQPKYGWATAARPGTERQQFGLTVNQNTGHVGLGFGTERRKANDGGVYSKEEFKLHYGDNWQWRWDNAAGA